jgi:hypothetical protein
MADPFLSEARAERTQRGFGLLLVIALIGAAIFVAGRNRAIGGETVEARVLRFGSYATEVGEMPLVVVQLDNGSTAEVRAGRNAIAGCERGSTISLVQKGRALGVGPKGCHDASR